MSKKVKAQSRLLTAHEFIVVARQDTALTTDILVSDDYKQEFINELEALLKELKSDTALKAKGGE